MEAPKFLSKFNKLVSRPKLINVYVNTSLCILTKLLSPVQSFMRHLIVIQGLDPDRESSLQNSFAEQLERVFEGKSYTPKTNFVSTRFNNKLIHIKYKDVNKKLPQLNLTEDKFEKLTDLERLANDADLKEQARVVAKVATDKEAKRTAKKKSDKNKKKSSRKK